MPTIQFTVPGEPRGKGRPRFAKIGTFMRSYSPQETVSFENKVVAFFKQTWQKDEYAFAQGVPIIMTVTALFSKPASWSQKKKARTAYMTGKPDHDNILKVVSDALNKVAFHDDAQIASSQIHKLYTDDAPRVVIILSEVEAQSQGAT